METAAAFKAGRRGKLSQKPDLLGVMGTCKGRWAPGWLNRGLFYDHPGSGTRIWRFDEVLSVLELYIYPVYEVAVFYRLGGSYALVLYR